MMVASVSRALRVVIAGLLSLWLLQAGVGQAAGRAIIAGDARALSGDAIDIGGSRLLLFDVAAPRVDLICREWRGSRQVSYPCGAYALAFMASLVAGHPARCVPRGPTAEGKTATCFVDGRDLAEALIDSGWGVSCGAESRYALREEVARAARRGLWSGTFDEKAACRARNR